MLGLEMPKKTKLTPWFYRRENAGSDKLSDFLKIIQKFGDISSFITQISWVSFKYTFSSVPHF